MSVTAISTPFNISIDLSIAPVWKRVLAFIIDAFILWLYVNVPAVLIISSISDSVNDVDTAEAVGIGLRILLVGLPLFLYFPLSEYFFSGQSVGKRILKIRVVNRNGNEASLSQYLIRMLFHEFAFAPIAGWIIAALLLLVLASGNPIESDALTAIFVMLALLGMLVYYLAGKNGQRLGDKLADTLVIETHAAADIHQTIFLDIEDEGYVVRYPEVMKLTDRDINGIRNMLDVKRITPESEAYMLRIAGRIEQVLKIQREQEPYDFLAQLLRDYNYLTRK